jgi:hypothetical protein
MEYIEFEELYKSSITVNNNDDHIRKLFDKVSVKIEKERLLYVEEIDEKIEDIKDENFELLQTIEQFKKELNDYQRRQELWKPQKKKLNL